MTGPAPSALVRRRVPPTSIADLYRRPCRRRHRAAPLCRRRFERLRTQCPPSLCLSSPRPSRRPGSPPPRRPPTPATPRRTTRGHRRSRPTGAGWWTCCRCAAATSCSTSDAAPACASSRSAAGSAREGVIVGVDASREMLAVAAARVADRGWRNVLLVQAPVEEAELPVVADHALFCATHDVLQSDGRAGQRALARPRRRHGRRGGRQVGAAVGAGPERGHPRAARAVRARLRRLRPPLGAPGAAAEPACGCRRSRWAAATWRRARSRRGRSRSWRARSTATTTGTRRPRDGTRG